MSSGKRPFGTQLDVGLIEQLRNTVLGLRQVPGQDPTLTQARFVSDAIEAAIDTAQQIHNAGRPFSAPTIRNEDTRHA